MLELLTKHGAFWEVVQSLRHRWAIEPAVRVPPSLPAEVLIYPWEGEHYFPHPWPDRLPPSPLADASPEADDLGADPSPDADLSGVDESKWRRWWFKDLWRLHDVCIPPECRHHGPCPAVSWATFLSACLLYNPPRTHALAIADAAVMVLDAADPDDPNADLMMHAPLVKVRDERVLEEAFEEFHEEVFAALCEALAPMGIDLRALRAQIAIARPELMEHARDRLRAVPWKRCIDVSRADVTKADVIQAFELVRSTHPKRPTPKRPKRDPLVCVQCAIWHDEEGRTYEQIGKRFGWDIQYPAEQKPRCETARQHVAEGRRFLHQEKGSG
ncbi:MAG: hypothetical protein ACJ789_10985 [Thermomicrobiales bacterium]